jgi:hypothetical protein
MTKYKIAVALLCSTGFTCLVPLLMLSAAILSVPLSILLLPGGIVADVIARPKLSAPLLVLAANIVTYSPIAYAGVSLFAHGVATERMRLIIFRLLLPVAILAGLACVPKLDPLFPHGMVAMANQESELRAALPLGLEIEQARTILKSRGIKFQEEVEATSELVLKREDGTIVAAAGDRLISSRIQTEATQFPCSYDIEIVLLFGQNDRLKQEYVKRLRLCT